MSKISWFGVFLCIVMMSVVGFLVFDNIASSLIFGIGVGGWLFTTKVDSRLISTTYCCFRRPASKQIFFR
jgi:hypothetical protein